MKFFKFSKSLAIKIGLECALLFTYLVDWINYNAKKDKNFRNGKYWTYISYEKISEEIGVLSADQVGKYIRKLVNKEKLLVRGNYNNTKHDRTSWYALSEKGLSLLTECDMHYAKLHNGKCDNATSIIKENKTEAETSSLIQRILDYLNSQAGSTFDMTDKRAVRTIQSRLEDGYTEDDFKTVINRMVEAWGDSDKMCSNLRPTTLFGNKMGEYLHMPVKPYNHNNDSSRFNEEANDQFNEGQNKIFNEAAHAAGYSEPLEYQDAQDPI